MGHLEMFEEGELQLGKRAAAVGGGFTRLGRAEGGVGSENLRQCCHRPLVCLPALLQHLQTRRQRPGEAR